MYLLIYLSCDDMLLHVTNTRPNLNYRMYSLHGNESSVKHILWQAVNMKCWRLNECFIWTHGYVTLCTVIIDGSGIRALHEWLCYSVFCDHSWVWYMCTTSMDAPGCWCSPTASGVRRRWRSLQLKKHCGMLVLNPLVGPWVIISYTSQNMWYSVIDDRDRMNQVSCQHYCLACLILFDAMIP